MKKVLSIFLSLIIVMGVVASVSIPASAATGVNFNTTYSYTYSNSKNCYNTVVLSQDGVVCVDVVFPKSTYGNDCVPDLIVTNSSGKQLFKKIMNSSTGRMFVFLNKGIYNFNFYMDYYSLPTTAMLYRFQYRANSNDKVQNVTLNKTYSHYYNTQNAKGKFTINSDSTVKFELSKPAESSSSKSSTYLYVYDSKGKEVFSEYHSYYDSLENYYYSVRLAKGTYTFNYKATSAYSTNNGYTVDSYAYYTAYRVTATAAKKPKTPKITHKVKTTKYSSFTSYNITASFKDDQTYDGIELWVKKSNGKWKMTDSAKNTQYSRHTGVYLYGSSSNDYVIFYKVRTYSLYGTKKVYSNYSNVLYTKTSLKPSKPKVTVKSPKKKTAKISWKKISGVTGYEVYRSTKKSSGYKKVATVKKASSVSYTNKKLKSKKTYYYKVRSYKTINGVKIYSSYSSVKSVKVK